MPGWGQTGAFWVPVARWLGAAGVGLDCADLAALAEACAAPPGTLARTRELLDRLAEQARRRMPLVLLGHSAGAALAVLLAGHLPGVRALALVEPVPAHFGCVAETRPARPPVPSAQRHSRAAAPPGGPDRIEQALREIYPAAAATTLRTVASGLWAEAVPVRAAAVRAPGAGDPARVAAVRAALAAAAVPILIVRGTASTFLSGPDAQRLAAAVVGRCHLAVIPRAGHSPHVDRPRDTAAVLSDLARLVDDGALP
nr:alpha/beta hydrolase [Planosporangium thailandense]